MARQWDLGLIRQQRNSRELSLKFFWGWPVTVVRTLDTAFERRRLINQGTGAKKLKVSSVLDCPIAIAEGSFG
jgi:hypothetical protein